MTKPLNGSGSLTANAGDLVAALKLLRPVVASGRNTIPAFGAVLFDGANVSATDTEIMLTTSIAVKRSTLSAFVNYRPMIDILSALPENASVKIAAKAGKSPSVVLSFNGGKYTLAALPVAEFVPMIWHHKPAKIHSGNAGTIAAMRRVRHAVSTEETRYYLNGIYLHKTESGAAVVATDGHRLSLCQIDGLNMKGGAIIPTLACDIAIGMKVEPSSIEVSESAIRFAWPGVALFAKLIDGTFPSYDRIIPKLGKKAPTLKVSPAALRGSLRRVSAVADARSKCFAFRTNGDFVSVSSTGYHVDKALEVVRGSSAKNCDDGFEIGFNARYIIDLLKNADPEDTLEFRAANPADPMICQMPHTTEIVMPMRLSDHTSDDDLTDVLKTVEHDLEAQNAD